MCPFPLYRGLIGYRVFLIEKGRQADFDSVQTLEDLSKLTAVQGTGWDDIKILRAAGLPVVDGHYVNLPKMLQARRGDYYPEGHH